MGLILLLIVLCVSLEPIGCDAVAMIQYLSIAWNRCMESFLDLLRSCQRRLLKCMGKFYISFVERAALSGRSCARSKRERRKARRSLRRVFPCDGDQGPANSALLSSQPFFASVLGFAATFGWPYRPRMRASTIPQPPQRRMIQNFSAPPPEGRRARGRGSRIRWLRARC